MVPFPGTKKGPEAAGFRPFTVMFAGGTWVGGGGWEERRKAHPRQSRESLVVVGALTVFGEIEALALGFFGRTQP